MANPLPIKKSFAALLSFLVLFSAVGPSGFALKIPTANAATFDVSNLNDAGAGSLRQAMTDANANGVGLDTITFSVAGTINLDSDLPGLTNPVVLDATTTTQAGANIVLNAAGRNVGLMFNGGTGNAVYGIAITGAQNCFEINNEVTGITLGNSTAEGGIEASSCSNRGFDLTGASNVVMVNASILSNATGIVVNNNASNITIGGTTSAERVIIAGNTQNGVSVSAGSNITIQGSYIGVDGNGDTQANGQNGIFVDNLGATDVIIGGSTAGERNIISGNTLYGVSIQSNAVTIKGNYIGTDPTGLLARANEEGGIQIESADNTIGGDTAAERNVISGNSLVGIRIDDSVQNADGNTIRNNYIGQNADGSGSLPNTGDGILLSGGNPENTVIGGNGTGNVISGNNSNGINLINGTSTTILGNILGLSPDGLSTRANGFNGISLNSGNTTVGEINVAGSRNFISGNDLRGIYIQSSSNTVVNNCIGTNLSCETDATLRNGGTAIDLMNTAANNTIGGDATGAANTIHQINGQMAISVGNTAGNNNTFQNNNFLDLAAGSQFTSVTTSGNESISNPTLTSVTRVTPNTVEVVGNTSAGYRVDVFAGGLWAATGTANGSGIFSIITSSLATNYTVIASTGTGSSSGTPAIVLETPDATPPTAPTAAPSVNPARPGQTVTISGTGEEGTSVYSNGVDTGVDVDGSQNYSFNVTALTGVNSIQVTLVDGMSNVSAGTAADFTANSGGGVAVFAGAGASDDDDDDDDGNESETGNTVDPDSQTTIDTGTTTEGAESLAGDKEVVDEVTSENTSNTPNTDATQSTNDSSDTVEPPVEPVKSFIEAINEIAQPIKVQAIRDTLPKDPLVQPKFNATLDGITSFGPSSNTYGIPDKIVTIKQNFYNLTSENLNLDSDGDGLTDGEEITYLSNPLMADSDGDGEDDIQEVFVTGTDPSTYDTDRDGLADTVDSEPLVYSNPETRVTPQEVTGYIAEQKLTTSPGVTDSDNDGLADLLELYLDTDPLEADSDEDGLTDGDEYTQYGTDPNEGTSSSQSGGVRIVNVTDEEVVVEGQQFYMGQGPANTKIGIYEIDNNGSLVPMGETKTDEFGRFNLLTDNLNAGTHSLIAIAGDSEDPIDISAPFDINALKYVEKPEYESLSGKNSLDLSDQNPILGLTTADDNMIVISWRSTIYSQVIIGDAADQTVYAKPAVDLELGDHTVTWYAVDPEDNQKSEPTQVAFTITNTAFINGETASNLWTIIFGSIAALSSLAALGLYFRKGKVSR